MESLTDKLNGKPHKSITYITQNKRNLSQLLLQEASNISRANGISGADLEFWKLAVSSSINLMNLILETRLSTLYTNQQLNAMKEYMLDQKTAFEITSIASDLIDSLFDSLLHHQLE